MLDDRVREVLARLEAEDAADREAGLPSSDRSLPVGPEAGRLLFALVAPNPGCEVLEIGGSRGYSTVGCGRGADLGVPCLARARPRRSPLAGNIEAGLEERQKLVEGAAT